MESPTPDGPSGPAPRPRRQRPPLHRWRTRARSWARWLGRLFAWIQRALSAVEQSHYRRFLVSFVAGIVVLGAMRVPEINRSIFGEPDRQMMDSAFQIRTDRTTGGDPALMIDIDDSTIASVQGTSGPPRAPAATAPRAILADVLEYIRTAPPGKGALAVIVDMDLATPTPGDEAGVAKLHKVMEDWAKTPSAPELLLARQSFPEAIYGGQGAGLILPATDFDDIVNPAPNMMWANVKMMGDQNGFIREFRPYECVSGPGGPMVLYSASLLAYGFLEQGHMPADAPVTRWTSSAEKNCASKDPKPIDHGELINYHLSLGVGENGKVWPDAPPTWPGAAICGPGADRAIFRRISAGDVAAAGPDASHELLCQHLVVIGGTNVAAADFEQTPLNEMSGTMIIVNAVQGLEMSGGGLKRVPLWLQLLTLLVVSGAITAGFWITRKIRDNYLSLKTRTGARYQSTHPFWWLVNRLRLAPFNPVVLNFVFAFTAHWVGIGLLLVALDRGYWGYLSAPAFASAAVGAMQEFADDES
jgi:hypothetical protein